MTPSPVKALLAALAATLLALTPARAQPASSPAHPTDNEPVRLSVFEVTSSKDDGYRATNAISGTRLDTPIKDLPLTINVLTRELLEDIGALEFNDVLKYATGVYVRNNDGDNYVIRGQRIDYKYRDGMRRYDFAPTANIERVEILKGPTGILYGISYPGGVINYVTKRPDFAKAAGSASVSAGSFEAFGATLDLNRPLVAGKLAARVNLSTSEGGSFTRNVHPRQSQVAPTLAWRPFAGTEIIGALEYSKFHTNTFVGSGANNARPRINATTGAFVGLELLPRDFGPAGGSFRDNTSQNLWLEVRQQVAKNFTLRAIASFSQRQQEYYAHNIFFVNTLTVGTTTAPGFPFFRYNYYNFKWRNWDRDYQVEGTLQLATGPLAHRILFGAQASRQEFLGTQRDSRPGTVTINATTPLSAGLPALPAYFDLFPGPQRVSNFSNKYISGAFVMDTVKAWDDRLNALLGLRHTDIALRNAIHQKQNATNPITGLVYRPVRAASLYAVYSESFNDQGGTFTQPNLTLLLPPPFKGKGVDIGSKYEFLGGRLTGAVTWFETKRANQVARNVATNFFEIVGEITSRGWEGELNWTPLPNWSIVAGATYLGSVRTTKAGNPVQLGTVLTPFIRHSEQLFNKYTVATGPLKGLALGGGVNYVARNFQGGVIGYLPAYATVDLLANYSTKLGDHPVTIGLNAKNIFDRVYQPVAGIYSSTPSFNLSLRTRF